MSTYRLVQWPESQDFMEHERFHECLLVQDIDNHDEVGSSAYMVPIDLYYQVYKAPQTVCSICLEPDCNCFAPESEYMKLLWEAYKAGHGPDTVGGLMELEQEFNDWLQK